MGCTYIVHQALDRAAQSVVREHHGVVVLKVVYPYLRLVGLRLELSAQKVDQLIVDRVCLPQVLDAEGSDLTLQIPGVCPQVVEKAEVPTVEGKRHTMNDGVVDAMKEQFQVGFGHRSQSDPIAVLQQINLDTPEIDLNTSYM